MTRQRHYKAGLNGLATRKATIAAFLFGTQAVVEFRVLDVARRKDLDLTMSLPQAREAVRLLSAAIEAAELVTRADGPVATSSGRAPAGRDTAHAGEQATRTA